MQGACSGECCGPAAIQRCPALATRTFLITNSLVADKKMPFSIPAGIWSGHSFQVGIEALRRNEGMNSQELSLPKFQIFQQTHQTNERFGAQGIV